MAQQKINIANLPSRRPFGRRRKVCPFSGADAPAIDYKDVKLLQRYISEKGKIRNRRITGACRRHQRQVAAARVGPDHDVAAMAVAVELHDVQHGHLLQQGDDFPEIEDGIDVQAGQVGHRIAQGGQHGLDRNRIAARLEGEAREAQGVFRQVQDDIQVLHPGGEVLMGHGPVADIELGVERGSHAAVEHALHAGDGGADDLVEAHEVHAVAAQRGEGAGAHGLDWAGAGADLAEPVGGGAIAGRGGCTQALAPRRHFVARDDLRWLMRLSGPRVQDLTAVNQDVGTVVRALATRFGLQYQIDPGVRGLVNTTIRNAKTAHGVLRYARDPVAAVDAHANVVRPLDAGHAERRERAVLACVTPTQLYGRLLAEGDLDLRFTPSPTAAEGIAGHAKSNTASRIALIHELMPQAIAEPRQPRPIRSKGRDRPRRAPPRAWIRAKLASNSASPTRKA